MPVRWGYSGWKDRVNCVFLSPHECGSMFHPWVAGGMVVLVLAAAAAAGRPVVVVARRLVLAAAARRFAVVAAAQTLELDVQGPAHSLAPVLL